MDTKIGTFYTKIGNFYSIIRTLFTKMKTSSKHYCIKAAAQLDAKLNSYNGFSFFITGTGHTSMQNLHKTNVYSKNTQANRHFTHQSYLLK